MVSLACLPMARPNLDKQVRALAEEAGWTVEHPLPGVLLLSRPDLDVRGGPPIPGRTVTVLAGGRNGLTTIQRWFMDGRDADVFVVDAGSLHMLQLALGEESSDEAARAEFQLDAEQTPPWNGAGPSGIRPRPRPLAARR